MISIQLLPYFSSNSILILNGVMAKTGAT